MPISCFEQRLVEKLEGEQRDQGFVVFSTGILVGFAIAMCAPTVVHKMQHVKPNQWQKK